MQNSEIKAYTRNFLIRVLKSSKLRGRARMIKWVSKLSPSTSYLDYGDIKLPLDLSKNTEIGLFLHNGINHERQILTFLELTVDEKDIFYDIGANIGFYSNFFVNKCKKVVAIEPNPFLRNKYSHLLKHENFRLIPQGVSDKESTLPFSTQDSNHDLGNFRTPENEVNSQLIEVNTLSNIIEVNNLPKPTIIKIDVEGFELNVLRGYKELEQHRPLIIFEYIEKFALSCGYDIKAIEAFFYDIDYRLKVLNKDGELIDISEKLISADIVAFPE